MNNINKTTFCYASLYGLVGIQVTSAPSHFGL